MRACVCVFVHACACVLACLYAVKKSFSELVTVCMYAFLTTHPSVFRKKTHTDWYLHYDSNHPTRVKRGIIQCLRHRAEKVCDGSTQWPEIRHLRQVFKANDYPHAVMKKNLRVRPTPANSSQTNQPAPKLLLLPYIPGLSEKIEGVCRPLGVKTVCKSRGTLRNSLVRVKQPREDKKKKGVIYE